MYDFLQKTIKTLFKILYKVEIKGNIDLPDDKGYMICSNHIHLFDPIFIACFVKRQISFMGKKELFDKPILGFLLRKLGAFPINRGKRDIEAIKTAIKILSSNYVLAIFPEGTRSKDGKIGEFKKGASLVASRANVPIVPVKIEGNYKLFSKIVLKIGKPLYPTKENKKTLTTNLYNSILNL